MSVLLTCGGSPSHQEWGLALPHCMGTPSLVTVESVKPRMKPQRQVGQYPSQGNFLMVPGCKWEQVVLECLDEGTASSVPEPSPGDSGIQRRSRALLLEAGAPQGKGSLCLGSD